MSRYAATGAGLRVRTSRSRSLRIGFSTISIVKRPTKMLLPRWSSSGGGHSPGRTSPRAFLVFSPGLAMERRIAPRLYQVLDDGGLILGVELPCEGFPAGQHPGNVLGTQRLRMRTPDRPDHEPQR